jgi:hypothetical protein
MEHEFLLKNLIESLRSSLFLFFSSTSNASFSFLLSSSDLVASSIPYFILFKPEKPAESTCPPSFDIPLNSPLSV